MKPFDKGYSDFQKGQVGNPHEVNTNKYREWQRGWDSAYFDNLEKVKENERSRKGS